MGAIVVYANKYKELRAKDGLLPAIEVFARDVGANGENVALSRRALDLAMSRDKASSPEFKIIMEIPPYGAVFTRDNDFPEIIDGNVSYPRGRVAFLDGVELSGGYVLAGKGRDDSEALENLWDRLMAPRVPGQSAPRLLCVGPSATVDVR